MQRDLCVLSYRDRIQDRAHGPEAPALPIRVHAHGAEQRDREAQVVAGLCRVQAR
ncbi:unnamed protein product [Linum tenue]|uniref:Uncharacterized protein n=1 Tax=Linum tenue TaxID=586396 RepID=A0AAV0P875_9ROSI|nr:unnamed protein product [Linum tenue]